MTKQLVRGTGMGGGIGSVLYTEDASAANRSFFCYNAVGSTVALADASGAVTSTTDYAAFGKEVKSTGSSDETRKFCTKERSASIGLDNFGFRYYDPELGRFVQRDPSGYPDGANNYLYCRNNPINHIDPLGLDSFSLSMIREVGSRVASYTADKMQQVAETIGSPILSGAATMLKQASAANLEANKAAPLKIADAVGSAVTHAKIAKETGASDMKAVYQAVGMVANEQIPVAKGAVEAYDAKSYSSGDFNRNLGGLERAGRAGESVASAASITAMILSGLRLDVNLTGPNKGINPYTGKPLMKVKVVKSPEIKPKDLKGKTPEQIRDMANKKNLNPVGNKKSPDYPRKWKDPITNKERLRIDKGHIDKTTGKPYNNPNAAKDHVHGYDTAGRKIVEPKTKDPHFPLKKD